MDQFTTAYIEAMLWSTCLAPYGECPRCEMTRLLPMWAEDPDDTSREYLCTGCSNYMADYEPPADENYGACDISDDLMERIREDCASFQADNSEPLSDWYEKCGETEERAGHDFWLTRERHGAGFWDRWDSGTSEGHIGKLLTDAAHSYGEMYLYVGDDGKIYGS